MKSSRSSSQLTDGGAVGGAALLDEPLDFTFISFLVLGSCTGCKDRWTKRGGELGLFQISKIVKTTLTYAKLVRLNSPTG